MSTTTSTTNTSFKVKEDVLLNFLIAGLCLVFASISLFNWTNNYVDYLSLIFFLIPAIFFTAKGIKNRTVITINLQGIYDHGKLVTDWKSFYNATLSEDQKIASISDNFVLMIKCYDAEKGKYYDKKIKLSNTQSKSEEAILAAIKHYHKLAKEGLNR